MLNRFGLHVLRLLICSLLAHVDLSLSFVIKARASVPALKIFEEAVPNNGRPYRGSTSAGRYSPSSSTSRDAQTIRDELKRQLLELVESFRRLQEQDGSVPIDFGVKGGELNATTRAPQKVNYYAVSTRVGQAADAIVAHCNQMSAYNPIEAPTRYLGNKNRGAECPLQGAWKLLFTTAADASFSKNSTRGDATAQNIVDASRGRITNVIDFKKRADGSDPILKQLNVVIKATAESDARVALKFRYAKAVLTKFFFLPVRWSLYIPVPAPFITRLIVFFYRIFRRKLAKAPPKAYFDVVYLDEDLRIHKTGEDNLFVQVRPEWSNASSLID